MASAAILTPYTGQVRLITNMLRQQGLEQVRPGPQRATLPVRAAWRRRCPGLPSCPRVYAGACSALVLRP